MGTNTVALFLDAHLDFIAQKLDDWTFKKGPVDIVDKGIYRLSLGMLNKAVSDDIPDDMKPGLHKVFDKVIAKDFDDAGADAAAELARIVEVAKKMNDKVKYGLLALLAIVQQALASLD